MCNCPAGSADFHGSRHQGLGCEELGASSQSSLQPCSAAYEARERYVAQISSKGIALIRRVRKIAKSDC